MNKGFTRTEAKIGILLILIVIIEKMLSFGKNIMLAYYFGIENSMDLYYISTNIISLFNTCFCISLPMSFLAVYINIGMKDEIKLKQTEIMSNAISAFSMIAATLTCLLFLFAPLIERVLAPNDTGNPNDRLSSYIRILSFIVVFYCLSGLFSASLECLEKYIPAKLTSLFVSISSVLSVLIFGQKHGAIVVAYGSLMGIVCHALFTFLILRKYRSIKVQIPRFDNNIKRIIKMSVPMMISTGIMAINSLVDKLVALNVGEGNVSALNYGSLLTRELVGGVVITSISSIILARFSDNYIHKEIDELNRNINVVIRIMLLFIIPLTIYYICYAKELISFIFERGNFGISASNLTAVGLLGYTIGLVFIPFREVFLRIQYAYQDSKHPLTASVITVIFNVFLSIILGLKIGILGISIATSISIFFNCIINYIHIKRLSCIKLKMQWKEIFIMSTNGILVFVIILCIKKSYEGCSILVMLALIVRVYILYIFMCFMNCRTCINDIRLILKRNVQI